MRGTAYSKLEKGDGSCASEEQQAQASGLGRESQVSQPSREGQSKDRVCSLFLVQWRVTSGLSFLFVETGSCGL